MKIINAIKKLQTAGFKIVQNGKFYTAAKDGSFRVIEFHQNGNSDRITCIGFRYANDHSDPMTDYCATTFCDNLTQAIKHVI